MGPQLPFNHTILLPHHLVSPFYLLITCFPALSSFHSHLFVFIFLTHQRQSPSSGWEFKEASSMQWVISTPSFFFENSLLYSCSHQQPQASLSSVFLRKAVISLFLPMLFNCDILSWRSWSGIMLCKPEVVQYDRNRECSCYHQRPSGCWIKMTLVGEKLAFHVGIVYFHRQDFFLSAHVYVKVSLSYIWTKVPGGGVYWGVLLHSSLHWERDISMCMNSWQLTTRNTGQNKKTGRHDGDGHRCLLPWTQINNLWMWVESLSCPVCLSSHRSSLFVSSSYSQILTLCYWS